MFYKIFRSPQVKRWLIITYKDGIYDLPVVLLNDLRLRKLENIRKVSKLQRMIAQCPILLAKENFCQYQQKRLEKQQLNFSRSVLYFMKTRFTLKYIVTHSLWKSFLDPHLSHTHSNLISSTILVILRFSTLF